jgi:hypothetical protein
MAEFVVNVMLIGALLLLLIIWAVSAGRRRRHSRREHAEERRLILSAFTGAGATSTALSTVEVEGPVTSPAAPAQLLDAVSVAALLDLLEDRRPARRGLVAGLFTSPRSVWSAGTRAGQHIGRYTIGEQNGPAGPAGPSRASRN